MLVWTLSMMLCHPCIVVLPYPLHDQHRRSSPLLECCYTVTPRPASLIAVSWTPRPSSAPPCIPQLVYTCAMRSGLWSVEKGVRSAHRSPVHGSRTASGGGLKTCCAVALRECGSSRTYFSCDEKSSLVSSSSQDSSQRCFVASLPPAASVSSGFQSAENVSSVC